uniref:Glycoside hydrolase family 2 catalytic domain-containing protein n=1 Tax=Ignisphaera aggregans TaxID=334771 RepID=A0A7J3Z6D6_9CREN
MKSWFRPQISLEGFWKFRIDKEFVGDREEWFKGFTSSDTIYVPSSWNEQNLEWDQFTGVAWYQRDVYIDAHLRDRIAWMVFEGAGYRTSVWVNSSFVGEHEGSFTQFRFRVNEIKFGCFNRVVVRIDNTPSVTSLPPARELNVTAFDFFHYGGIHSPPQMWSEEYQAEFIRSYVEVLMKISYVIGLHIWNFADFRVPQNPGRAILNRKGVYSRDRQPKLAVVILSELFKSIPTYMD